jgi:hypothetical protein
MKIERQRQQNLRNVCQISPARRVSDVPGTKTIHRATARSARARACPAERCLREPSSRRLARISNRAFGDRDPARPGLDAAILILARPIRGLVCRTLARSRRPGKRILLASRECVRLNLNDGFAKPIE